MLYPGCFMICYSWVSHLFNHGNEITVCLCIVGDFMKDGAVYEDMLDFKALKKYMEDQMEDYNMEPGVIAMNLVLFRDAIEHGECKK